MSDAPLISSCLPDGAGCAAGPGQAGAGCAGTTGEGRQADTPPQECTDSTGCAASLPVDAGERKATPPQTLREFERALRAMGFSGLQAKRIAVRGWAGVAAQAEAEDTSADGPDLLREALERLQRAIES